MTTPSALSTLLNYALEGLRRLEQQGGFSYSQTIKDQVKTYQMESDVIMLFIDEECQIESEASKQHESRIECKRLHAIYSAWCKQGGFKPETTTKFNKHSKKNLRRRCIRRKPELQVAIQFRVGLVSKYNVSCLEHPFPVRFLF